MDNMDIAKKILPLIGGKDNVQHLTHCITRLRITVTNLSIINKDEIAKITGVLGVNESSGQFQIILGNRVGDVYTELKSLLDIGDTENSTAPIQAEKKNFLSAILDAIAGIFSPVIPAIVGAGLLKGIIVMLTTFDYVSPNTETYKLLTIFGDSAFYFLPIILGVSACLKFKCNPYIGAALGGILLHPQLASVVTAGTEYMHFFGIPMKVSIYVSSVLPIILTVWFMSYVEKWLAYVIPKSLKGVFQPVVTLIIVAPVMLTVLGPIGSIIGNLIASGFIYIYSSVGIVAGLLLGGFWGPIVITGMHYGFLPVMLESLSKTGFDYVMAIAIAGNSATAGAAFAVYLMTKNKDMKAISGAAAVNATIGITEPALFGVSVKLKKPLIASCIAGALGGSIMGYFHIGATGIGTGPLAGLAFFFGPNFVHFVIGCLVSFFCAMIFTKLLGFEGAK